jgi:sugar phosphate isomerase/epimerase
LLQIQGFESECLCSKNMTTRKPGSKSYKNLVAVLPTVPLDWTPTYHDQILRKSGQTSRYSDFAEVGAWSNPLSPDRPTANAAFEKCVRSLQLAEEIGANCCVNIAGSRHKENWSGPHEENFSEDTFDQIVEVTRKIIDEVNPKRTFFTLEAMPWIFPESADSYLQLLKAIDRKAFAVHLDPVNMVTSPAIFYKNGDLIKECFAKLGPHIKSCHAKDLVLKQRTFMPQFEEVRPGLGKMDYRVFVAELRKLPEVPLMLEHLQTAEEYREGMTFISEIAAS